jgi:ribosome-associated toxin RatA of RatAB toxin-antitoxin module
MPIVRRSLEVALPAEELFTLAQDYSLRKSWDPLHGDHEFLDGTASGPGAVLRYRAKNGARMTVRYVSYQRPERVAMTMVSGPFVFERFSGSWNFKRLDARRTLVVFQYHFTLRRWVSWALEPVTQFLLERSVAARLEGLKRFAEGQPRN